MAARQRESWCSCLSKGSCKTACLVHLATDQLFNDKHVIHVSFSSRVDHIVSWYEDIFKEISKMRDLENAVSVHDEIVKNRVIMNFNQEGISTDQILKSISAMITDGNFAADQVLFDGTILVKPQWRISPSSRLSPRIISLKSGSAFL